MKLESLDPRISIYLEKDDRDVFGIRKIYRDAISNKKWYSTKWSNGIDRILTFDKDPYDDWLEFRGTGTYHIDGNGYLKISGTYPRIYIYDPNLTQWHDVEITFYAMRISDSNNEHGGMMAYARTKHNPDTDLCDTRGYGGRLTYDGRIDFEKETRHGGNYDQKAGIQYWPNGLPYNMWLGYKFIIYDTSNGVKLELWEDFNNDNIWSKVIEFTDTGSNFGVNTPSCCSSNCKNIYGCTVPINSALKLTSSENRCGSETGKPNLVVYFRSDDVNNEGLIYQKAGVREITTTLSPILSSSTYEIIDNNKILTLEYIQNNPLDYIIELYRQGYSL